MRWCQAASLSVRLSVLPSSCISAAPTGWMSMIWHWVHLWKSDEKIHICLKSGKNFEHFMWRPKSLYCCRRHNVLESNGIRLLGLPTRYKPQVKSDTMPRYTYLRCLSCYTFPQLLYSVVSVVESNRWFLLVMWPLETVILLQWLIKADGLSAVSLCSALMAFSLSKCTSAVPDQLSSKLKH